MRCAVFIKARGKKWVKKAIKNISFESKTNNVFYKLQAYNIQHLFWKKEILIA